MSYEYLLEIPGLADRVKTVSPGAGRSPHAALLQALCQVPGLHALELATERGDTFLVQRRVFTAAGDLVHDDHRSWLAQEFVNDGARAGVTHKRLLAADLRLSQTEISTLYLVVDRGGEESNFLQIEVELHTERLSHRLMGDWGGTPRDVRDLVDEACGLELPAEQQIPLGTPQYRLSRVIDMARFLEIIDAAEERVRQRARSMRFDVVDPEDGAPKRKMGYAEMDPGFDKYPAKGRRLFRDWASSSAGQSGHRLCRHWVMQISDHRDAHTQARWLSLVPLWTYGKPLAQVDASKGTVQALHDKLCSIDRRTGVPFAWFFYMLHGNRVREGAGHRILAAAESGQIDLTEQDYQVLRRWKEREYGF
ncbi:hypothetical protein LJR189_004670 [Acidovorax delafieldii]|uniref:hypothetical protein n=1 Tax=Acidovorax delafieldii TaxID=47920 RepID=UPI003ECFA2DE